MTPRLSGSLGICVVTLAIALSAQKPPLDYTQWRGQTHDGSASAFTEPKPWPETLTQRSMNIARASGRFIGAAEPGLKAL
jgi:hypothetical protein